MKKLLSAIKNSIKKQINIKELCLTFVSSFIVIALILLVVAKRSFGSLFLIETLGMAIVFTIMFAMIKVYTDLLDLYYTHKTFL